MTDRRGVHKVGLTASALGLSSVCVMPFTVLAANRLRTGSGVSLAESVGAAFGAVLIAGWIVLLALSIRDDRRRLVAAARGLLSLALILATIALVEVAAMRMLPEAGTFARVSVGSGAWVSAIAAYALLLASRREVGARTVVGAILTFGAPLGIAIMLMSGFLSDLGMLKEYQNLGSRFWLEVRNTVVYSIAALGVATVIGFALGVLAFRKPRFEGPIFAVVNVFQTIPGLAMIGLLFVPLAWLRQNVPFAEAAGIGGLGWAPVVTALALYALLAITHNTYAGLKGVPAEAADAGVGMGMTRSQVMWRVSVPLAVPVLLSGERTATVQTIGNATLGAFVAAFTLGTTIFGGLAQQALDLTMLGSVALVVLAIAADGLLRMLQRAISPRHATGTGVRT